MTESPIAIAKASVLLIGDDEEAWSALVPLLREAGYAVTQVESAALALAAFERDPQHVTIVDHDLQGGGGAELSRTLKRLAPTVEVISVSARADPSLALERLRAHDFDFFQKPFDHASMIASVDRAARRQTSDRLLREASQVILSTKEIERLPKAIAELSLRAMDADDVSLMLLDDDGKLYVAYSHGLPASVGAVSVALDQSIAGRVARAGAPTLISHDIGDDPRFLGLPSSARVLSSIVYPLSSPQRLTGVLNISRLAGKPPFDASDMPRAAFLASQALLALENATLVRRIVVSERMAAIGQLASGFAHEINNPLSFVLMNLALIREGIEPLNELVMISKRGGGLDATTAWLRDRGNQLAHADIGECVVDTLEGAERIRDIVADLKSFSSVAQQHRAEFDLNDAIRSALRIAASAFRKEVEVVTELGPDTRVFGGVGQLSQVFLNLFVNAAHATEGQGPNRRVLVRTRCVGDRAVTEIADNGHGILPEHQHRIFEAFFTTKPFGKGTGLGLSISRDIVRNHGGELRVDSVPGEGATFTVSLPLAGT